VNVNRELRLSAIPDFPTGLLPGWTLGKLLDRATMIAQFDCGRWTFEETLFEAFGRIQFSPEIWAGWDDEMREHATECNRLANAAHAAVMKALSTAKR
jgi:hypothetical protein